tara:strand:- start:55083 stop:56213 length:1131 start_codon:yes stop_codon:yes gene_type:complete
MSNLLKEAIVDAKALRDSALKNAESTIIEKYSDEVRETLEQLLEQDELGGLGAEPVEEETGSTEEVAANIPLAATNDLNEDEGDIPKGIPGEGEEIPVNVNLDALQEAVVALENEIEESEEIDINEEELMAMLSEDDEESDDPSSQTWQVQPGEKEDPSAEEEESDSQAMARAGLEEEQENEESSLEEEDMGSLVDAIMEKLTVDMGADLTGWAGSSSEKMRWEMTKAIAARRSTGVEEELKDLKKAQEELVFENNQLTEQHSQYKQAFNELKETLHDVNLSNARLLYTNRVLRNTSLNERQKDKIAEAISKAGSVTEAKTIYNTLESTVESTPKRGPKSLSEAIGRRSSVLRATRQESTPSDPFSDRMKRLAGIK